MDVTLHRAGMPIDSVFGIHGTDENDLSGAFAFALRSSPNLLDAVIQDIVPRVSAQGVSTSIHVQTSRENLGITDIEIHISGRALIIFEAKKGAVSPSSDQMKKYAKVCHESGLPVTCLVTLTNQEVFAGQVPKEWSLLGVPVYPRSWRWLRGLVREARQRERGIITKNILHQLQAFLEGFMGLERAYRNEVYVLSLARGAAPNWSTTWIDIVDKHSRYFYPADGKTWPSPPNYLGFRYGGRLQSIHHVDSYEIVDDVRKSFPGSERGPKWGMTYLFHLGPAFRPNHVVPNGPRIRRAMRVWCMLDTLLTSATISDALALTERRRKEAEVEEENGLTSHSSRFGTAARLRRASVPTG